MKMTKTLSKLALAGAMTLSASAWSANAVLVNLDPPGLGLNDETPATPVGGNPGTTVGEQRVNVYLAALQKWGETIESDVDIAVGATFQPLNCSAAGGVLGAAGTTFVFQNFPGATTPDTWHHSALADSLAGFDFVPGDIDVISFFNSDIDDNDPNCLAGTSWYYGFDGANGDDIDFLAVVTHEINHGLGHANFANEATGGLFLGFPDVYTNNSLDLTLGKTWTEMDDTERQFSAVNSGLLVWNGPAVNTQAPSILGPRASVFVDDPDELEGSYEAQAASFGPALTLDADDEDLVLADDGVGVGTDACEPITNRVKGKIALIDRGGCAFTVKVKNAQDAGAEGAIIANNQPAGLTPMGGSDPTVTIPSVGITRDFGDVLKAALAGDGDDDDEVEVALGLDKRFTAGSQDGFVRLYAPGVVALGSSVSHWDTTASPNLLMEPFISDSLEPFNLDLSPALLQDIGWVLTNPLPTSGGGTGGGSGGSGGDDDDDDDDEDDD